METAAGTVYSCKFEFLTTFTFGTLRTTHTVATAFETFAKKEKNKEGSFFTCDQQFVMNCEEQNRSWKGMLCGEKQDLTSMAVSKKNL